MAISMVKLLSGDSNGDDNNNGGGNGVVGDRARIGGQGFAK